jgi:broad specificity phosphatase PhoE
MSIKIIYFVHGTTTDNEKGLATWWSHGELSDLWIQQAKDLWSILLNKDFDYVFSSDLQRAIDSANLMFWNRYKVIQDNRLRECDYWNHTDKPSKNFKSDIKLYIRIPFDNWESYKDVEIRMKSFVDFLKKNYIWKKIAIVSHQAPQLALDVILKNMTWNQSIDNDWRKTKNWKPGWEYIIK